MCLCMHMCKQYPQRLEEDIGFPEVCVMGRYESLEVDAWNQTYVFWKIRKHFYSQAIYSAPAAQTLDCCLG